MTGYNGHDFSAISYIENGVERIITAISLGARDVWSAVSNIWKSKDVWKSKDIW